MQCSCKLKDKRQAGINSKRPKAISKVFMVKIENIELPDFPLLLAPMEDVSDPPFRAVCKDNGADLMYTEFISSERIDQRTLLRRAGRNWTFSTTKDLLGFRFWGDEAAHGS